MPNAKLIRLACWSGLAYILLTVAGATLLRFIIPPWGMPHDPSASAEAIALLYQNYSLLQSFGPVMIMLSGLFYIMFAAVQVMLLIKFEKGLGVLSLSAIFANAMFLAATMMGAVLWAVAAFRPDRNPEIIQGFNDAAWIAFFGTAPMFCFTYVAVIFASIFTQGREAIFPRWYGYLNLLALFELLPGLLCMVFKTGPFAWNGLIVFWVAALTFGLVYAVSPAVYLRAVEEHLLPGVNLASGGK